MGCLTEEISIDLTANYFQLVYSVRCQGLAVSEDSFLVEFIRLEPKFNFVQVTLIAFA